MTPVSLTIAQRASIIDHEGHEPCPGVEIEFDRPLGAASDGGPELHATIYRPSNRPAAPTAVLLAFHGGGYQTGNPNGCGAIAKHLALTLGLTTVSSSYRLATQTKSTYPGILADAILTYRWVIAHATELNIDPRRIIVSGESAGVVLAAHLAVASPPIGFTADEPRPAAFICLWGCMDFVARWYDLNENAGAESTLLGGTYLTQPARYHQSSAVTFANGPLPPALFIYGRQDNVVHARQGQLGHAAWQAAGAYSELHILGNIGHNVQGENRVQRASYLDVTTGFLAKHLAQ